MQPLKASVAACPPACFMRVQCIALTGPGGGAGAPPVRLQLQPHWHIHRLQVSRGSGPMALACPGEPCAVPQWPAPPCLLHPPSQPRHGMARHGMRARLQGGCTQGRQVAGGAGLGCAVLWRQRARGVGRGPLHQPRASGLPRQVGGAERWEACSTRESAFSPKHSSPSLISCRKPAKSFFFFWGRVRPDAPLAAARPP